MVCGVKLGGGGVHASEAMVTQSAGTAFVAA